MYRHLESMIDWRSVLAHPWLQVHHAEVALGTALAADSLESCHIAFLAEVGRKEHRAETPRPGIHEANTDCSRTSLHVSEDQLMDIRTVVALMAGHRSGGRKAGHGCTFRNLELGLLFANDGFPDLPTAVAPLSTCDGASFRGWRPAMNDREESGCDGDFHGRYVWEGEVIALGVIHDDPRSDPAWSWHSVFHGCLHVDATSRAAENAMVDDRDRDGIPQYRLFFDADL